MSFPSKPHVGMEAVSPLSPGSPSSGFPFTRPLSSGQSTARRTSTSSILSSNSIGGNGESLGRHIDHVHEASQNSIATLLRPPIVRTGLLPHTQASAAATGYKAPTTRDIPPVALTNIPHVPPEEFRDYINRIEPLFENFRRMRQEQDQPQWTRRDDTSEQSRPSSRQGDDEPHSPHLSRQASLVGSPTPDDRASPRRRSSGQLRRSRNEPTPLTTIPDVYFETDFHLENPRTFDIVSERSEIVKPSSATSENDTISANGGGPPRKSLATNAILQEKLSWYMDTVEVHLINNISTASAGFFTALGSLKELQDEAAQSVQKIQGLRADLKRLDEEVALRGLEVIAEKKRAANLRKLSKATAQVEAVVAHITKADDSVDEGRFDDAADEMDQVASLMCGLPIADQASEDLIDLRRLHAFQGLDSRLQELQYRIGSGFALRFTKTLVDDLQKHVERVPRPETVKRWARQRGILPTYMDVDNQLRKDLMAALQGLRRAGHVGPATASYRDAINREMKGLIRKYLPSSTDDDADSMISTSTRGGQRLSQQEKSSILARNLRALDATDAEALLTNVYTSLSEALRRVSTQVKVLLDVASSMQTPETKTRSISASPTSVPPTSRLSDVTTLPESSAFDDLTQALDMSSLLGQAVDIAQTQISRILKVRSEQTTRLSKSEFLRYFHLNRLFADECEAVSGRSGQTLRAVIDAQITGFVQNLGSAETERIANLLDKDDWNAADFEAKDDAVLRRVLDSMSADPSLWTTGAADLWQETSSRHPEAPLSSSTSVETTTNGKAAAKPADIDGTRFILVRSTINLLESIENLLSLTASIPSLTPIIGNSLLEVLRTFNSRSCQLILGAGATRSAGLKNITTKHLALASQSLSFVIALIPYMRECMRRHLPSGNMNVLADFDKNKRLYQEHQSGIHDKLVEIMTSRCQAHVKAMKAINFDGATSEDSKVSPYMETLTKETLTLHRVLSRHLSEVDLDLIVRQIASNYKIQWIRAFGEASPNTSVGEARLLRDAECFHNRLGKVSGFDAIGKEIVGVVKAKVDGRNGAKKPAASIPVNTEDENASKADSTPSSVPKVLVAEGNGEKQSAEVLFDSTAADDATQASVVEKSVTNGEHSLPTDQPSDVKGEGPGDS